MRSLLRMLKFDLFVRVEANFKASIGNRQDVIPPAEDRGLKLGHGTGLGRNDLETDAESVDSASTNAVASFSSD